MATSPQIGSFDGVPSSIVSMTCDILLLVGATPSECNKSSTDACPLNAALYMETGDITSEPLLCHYPVKVHTHTNEHNNNLVLKKLKTLNTGTQYTYTGYMHTIELSINSMVLQFVGSSSPMISYWLFCTQYEEFPLATCAACSEVVFEFE